MVHAGEKFYKERKKLNLSLGEVSKATKIRESFLSAIEKSEYKKLPAGTYAYGFVRNYAKFLELPENEMLALFKREYAEEKFLKVLPEGLTKNENFPLSKFKFSQALKIIPVVLIILLIYILFQYRSAIFGSPLSVSYPVENAVINTKSITVTGKTDPNTTVFINSELATLDENGNFKKTINVFPGKEKIIIKVVNNFNKVTVLERHINVKP